MDATLVMSMVLVLVLRMQSDLQLRSKSAKIFCFRSRFSITASDDHVRLLELIVREARRAQGNRWRPPLLRHPSFLTLDARLALTRAMPRRETSG